MSDEVTTLSEEIELAYEWPYGPHGRQFFEGLQEGEFSGSRCPECGNVMVFPQPFCTLCFTEAEDETVPVEPTGRVHMYTYVQMPFPGQPTEPPYLWAFVDLDGADTSMAHVLDNVEPDEVEIGMRVRAVFKPEDEREGRMSDIAYFEPVDA